ncbi:MAG: hypothetical protein NUV74_05505 [Candidatus Brocadiaceae bacterium]|nr:hypothetical protein [Candidatus Brocadiaceae bacterium]
MKSHKLDCDALSDRLFCGMAWKWGFWFRIYGRGLHVKISNGHQPLFSERYGYRKCFYLFGLRFEPLKRDGNL